MKFSIITVVQNDRHNIVRTIKSVLSQTCKDYEYIIIDGNSSDGTSEIIKNYSSNRIRVFREKDKNLYDAINKGILKSKGNYVGFLHSGDLFISKNVLNEISLYLKKNTEILFSNLAFYDENFNITRLWRYKFNNLSKYNFFKIAHPTLFVKKNFYVKNSLYKINYSISSDLEYLFRLTRHKINYQFFDNYTVFMKIGGKSTSLSNFFKKLKEDLYIYFNIYKFYFLFFYIYKIYFKFYQLFNNRDDKRLLAKQIAFQKNILYRLNRN